LIFEEKKFISKNFEKMGYIPTNYSLSVKEDGTTTFGTMQIKGKETTFWKGGVKGDTVNGNAHVQSDKGSTKDYYFTGKLVKVIEPKEEPKAVPEQAKEKVKK